MTDLFPKSTLAVASYVPVGYLSILDEVPIFARAINQATFTDSATSLTFDDPDGGIGAYSDVEADMEIVIYDQATGVEKGRLRVAPGAATATVLQINEVSPGRLQLADNDRFAVLRSWRVRDRLVAASETFDKDSRVAFTDQTVHPEPIANSGGGPYANWAADATAVTYDARKSQAVAPSSADSDLTFAWTVPSGAIIDDAASGTPTIDYSGCGAGTHWGKLVVTDAITGKTATKRIPARLHDANDPPIDVLSVDYSHAYDRAATLTLTVPEMDLSGVADGAPVIFWLESTYNGVRAAYGGANPSHSHIQCVGYLLRSTVRRGAQDQTLTLEVATARGITQQLPGFSQVIESVTSGAANWQQMDDASVFRALAYLYRWGTTMLNVHDFTYEPDDYDYPAFYVEAKTPDAQVVELADAVDSLLVDEPRGSLALRRPLYYADAANRIAASTGVTLDDDVVLDAEVIHEHRYPNYQVELRMITTHGEDIFSRAPGLTPSEGPGNTIADKRIGTDQADADDRSGRVYARLNGLYYGKPTPQKVRLTLPDSYVGVVDSSDVDKWVYLNNVTVLQSAAGGSDDVLNGRGVLTEVAVRMDASGSSSVVWTLDMETNGVPGAKPPSDAVDTPPFTPPTYIPTPIALPPGRILPASGVLPSELWVMAAGEAKAARVHFDALGNQSAEDRSTGLLAPATWFNSNPWAFDEGFAYTKVGGGIEHFAHQGDAFTTADLRMSNAALWGSSSDYSWYGRMSHLVNGQGLLVHKDLTYRALTEDAWRSRNLITNSEGFLYYAMAPHNANVYYAARIVGSGSHTIQIWRSSDGGVTFPDMLLDTPINVHLPVMEIPYKRPGGIPNVEGEDFLILLGANIRHLYTLETVSGVLTVTGAPLGTDGQTYQLGIPPSGLPPVKPLDAYTHDAAKLYWAGVESAFGGDYLRIGYTPDFFATQVLKPTAIPIFDINFALCTNVEGWPPNSDCMLLHADNGSAGMCLFSLDNAEAFTQVDLTALGWAGGINARIAYGEFREATA